MTKILTTSEQDIITAGEILANGGLVAFPTETVYGLGANALDADAVRNIYTAKGRPSDNPLIVHIAEKEDIIPLVQEITPKAQALIDAFFPAPLTIILPKSEIVSNTVSGGLDTVAVRMPQNEIARRMIKASGCPIAAPSANTSGLPSPTRAKYVIDDMMGKVDAIIDGGDCKFGVESTVITLATDKPLLLRPGAITKEMIEEIIGDIDIAPAVLEGMKDDEIAASPGMKYKHYAPNARVIIVNGSKEQYEEFVNSRTNAHALCFDGDDVTIPKITYGTEGDDLSQARELFDALRMLDEMGAKKVYARMPSKSGVGMAVYNRLIRASAFCIIDLTAPFTIGLTGQTGAGKGYIGEVLKQHGFHIINCDRVAREVVQKNSPLLDALAEEFGQDIIVDGELDRRKLAKIAFASKDSTEKLNAIMHPAIMQRCRDEASEHLLTVLDAPQLFEAGGDKECYKVISVVAPESIRQSRIMERDGITADEARARMTAQLDENYFIDHSDYTITNDGRDVITQVENIIDYIL